MRRSCLACLVFVAACFENAEVPRMPGGGEGGGASTVGSTGTRSATDEGSSTTGDPVVASGSDGGDATTTTTATTSAPIPGGASTSSGGSTGEPSEATTGGGSSSGGEPDPEELARCVAASMGAITTTLLPGTRIVSNDFFRVDFEEDRNWAIANLVSREGSTENMVLTDGPDTASVLERDEGVGYYRYTPEPSALAFSPDGVPMSATMEALEIGPVLSRFAVTWAHEAEAMSGATTYVVIADGRVIRDQRVELGEGLPLFDELLSYVSLDRTRFDAVVDRSGSEGNRVVERVIADAEQTFNYASRLGDEICVHAEAGDVFGYVPNDVAFATSPLTSGSTWLRGESHLSLKQGWARVEVSSYRQRSLLLVSPYDPVGPCACVRRHQRAYNEPPTLLPQDARFAEPLRPTDVDGDGYDESGGFYDLVPEAARFELRSDRGLPSLLLRLATPTRPAGASVSVAGEAVPADRVLLQAIEGHGVYLLVLADIPREVPVVIRLEPAG